MSTLQRNQVYQLNELGPGDRFHLPGKKSKLATVIERVYNPKSGELLSIKVAKDGAEFPSYMKADKEVVYLRNNVNN